MKLQRKLADKVSSVRPQVQDQTTKITHNSPKDEYSVVEVKVILPFILTQTKILKHTFRKAFPRTLQ